MKKFLLLFVLTITLASCSSGWNCKARYVDMDTKYIHKHQKQAQPYDKYLATKYNIKG